MVLIVLMHLKVVDMVDRQSGGYYRKWDEYITATSSLVDTDKDGIPDGWEIAKGLNPNDASDGAKYNLSAAYTNLEVYLNGLVENTFPASHPK